jgi:hypothetical protein
LKLNLAAPLGNSLHDAAVVMLSPTAKGAAGAVALKKFSKRRQHIAEIIHYRVEPIRLRLGFPVFQLHVREADVADLHRMGFLLCSWRGR